MRRRNTGDVRIMSYPTIELQPPSKPKYKSFPSANLSAEENELVFQMLGPGRQSRVTAVVKLYTADSNNNTWTELMTGVGCYVRDEVRRGYFLEVYYMHI